MPKAKRKNPEPVRGGKQTMRSKGSVAASSAPATEQAATTSASGLPLSMPLSSEQLEQVSEAVANIMARQTSIPQCQMPIDPLLSLPCVPREEPDTGIEQDIPYNSLAQVQSYDHDAGQIVPAKLKAKIINGDYINLGLLIENVNGADPNDDTKYFSSQDGSIALAPKSRAKIISDIQTWTDAFLIYASIYSSAHPESRTHLFKYIRTIRLGASRVKSLGWRDYDIQFRLKKEANPSLSFGTVDQELWLLYVYNTPPTQIHPPQPLLLKCYDFNYKGQCNKTKCQYKHECMTCSRPHPYIKHRTTSGQSLHFRSQSGATRGAWRPQLSNGSNQPSSTFRSPYAQ